MAFALTGARGDRTQFSRPATEKSRLNRFRHDPGEIHR
jgi:hypothetical protein